MSQDLADGETAQVKGSGSSVYTLKNNGGVYSCTCPAWMHQGLGIERRTCKHLRAFRGDEAETARLGSAPLTCRPARPNPSNSSDRTVSQNLSSARCGQTWLARPAQNGERSSRLRTLPLPVLGSSSMNVTERGTL